MALVTKNDVTQIFAIQAPSVDLPPTFANYPRGWDTARSNNGKPTIKQFNYIQQRNDQNLLWIHQNGAALPYDAAMEYAENAHVVKDGELQKKQGASWVPAANKGYNLDYFVGGKSYPLNAEIMLANGDIVKSTTPNNITNPNIDMMGWKPQGNKSVAAPNDLTSIQNPKDGQVAYVESLQKNYIYNSANTYAPNSVTVVGKWEMETQDAYYASWFATPDVTTDQSSKLQAGHDYAVYKNNKPFIVDGVFYVEANQSYLSIENNAFIVRDNSKITFLPNAKFIQINQNKNQSNIVLMMRTKGATLIRPTLVGDRLTNTFLAPSSDAQGYGYGLTLYEPEDCFIFEPNCSQNHGDNIYIGKPWGSNLNILPKNITIVRPIAHHARRNCISLTAWDNVKIIDPIMSYGGDSDGITGAFPKCCIDVELENAVGFPAANGYNGVITNPKCYNSTNGFFAYCSDNDRNFDIHIQGDLSLNGITTIGLGLFHGSSNCTGLVKIDNIRYLSNMFQEIALSWNKNSKLTVEIDHVYPIAGDNSFEIASIINGAFSTKTLGNVTINNFHTVGFTPFTCDVGADYTVNGYKFFLAKDAQDGIVYYTNNAATQALCSGADTYIESKDTFVHSGFSVSTTKMPNEIWQTPPDAVTAVFLNTANDYRVLKIGLSYNGVVGQGCNIQGLNLLIGGVAKTTMKTLTLGGWVKFKNVSGGRTQILDMFGDWTYS